MKEAKVNADIKVDIIDSPIPSPGPGDVLIKVEVSGSNPKDWKVLKMYLQLKSNKFRHTLTTQRSNKPLNSGDDIAGTVVAIGSGVYEFRPGDRVAAFHEMMQPHGSFAEYAIAHDYSTFHIPQTVSFEGTCHFDIYKYQLPLN
jgi:NADPH:quinone reductase